MFIFQRCFYAIDPSKTSSLNSAQLDDFSGVFFFWIFRVWKSHNADPNFKVLAYRSSSGPEKHHARPWRKRFAKSTLYSFIFMQERGGGYPNQNDDEMTPQTSKILEKRRSIWQKGTIKCLKMHLFHVHVYSGSI